MQEIFWYFLKLGWLAFGGPVGQIGLMHLQVVERQKWIGEEEFVRALNFCHVLPGPEALQLAIYIGYKKRGYLAGALAGFLFILPGFITLTALAWIYVHYGETPQVLGVLWGFRPVALALLLPGRADAAESAWRRVFDISSFFLKVGLFSFGGAYAVLPYIREGAVASYGWISDREMIDALALGETTPGPLISIGIFVGYLAGHGRGVPWIGATAATFWLFLPSFVFVLGAAPHMDWLTSRPGVKEFLKGVTSGVVGLMFSISIPLAKVAFMPRGQIDWITVVLGLAAFTALTFWKWRLNVVAVVLGGGVLGLVRAFAPALFGGPLS